MSQAQKFLIAGIVTLFFSASAYAATTRTAELLSAYDYLSILLGVGISVSASLCRTAYSLAVEDSVVINSKKELFKDLVVASVGGLIATMCIRAGASLESLKSFVNVDVSVLLLFWAGWSRNAFFVWLASTASNVAAAIQNKLTAKVEGNDIPN